MSRTFPQLHQQITSSSDFIKAKRDAATFKTTAKSQNSKEYQDYDNNFIVSKEGNGCLISARSYKDYLSISKGKHYINPILSGASAGKYQSWMGAFLTFNQRDASNSAPAVQDLSYNNANGTFLNPSGENKLPFPPTTIEDDPNDRSLSSYPGYVEDPKLQFFYEKCKSTDNDLPRYITNFSELKPRERASNEYWRAVAGQSMTGFDFPSKPSLNLRQLTDLTNAPYAPTPIASVFYQNAPGKQWQRWCSLNGNTTNTSTLYFQRKITTSGSYAVNDMAGGSGWEIELIAAPSTAEYYAVVDNQQAFHTAMVGPYADPPVTGTGMMYPGASVVVGSDPIDYSYGDATSPVIITVIAVEDGPTANAINYQNENYKQVIFFKFEGGAENIAWAKSFLAGLTTPIIVEEVPGPP